jgi:nitroreductase
MDIFETINIRKSIRQYTSAPVSDGDLNRILEAARRAPSWKNSQCWRFIIVRDNEMKNKLAGTLPPLNGAAEGIRNAPLTIIVCAELYRAGFKQGQPETDKGDWFMYDVGMAMEHICLAAAALGLGTVHVGLFDAVKAGKILGVPEGYTVVTMTPLGYPEGESKVTGRKEIGEIVFNERFGNVK